MEPDAKEKALQIAEAADDRRALDIEILDMRGLMTICDFFVICNGRSRLHVDAVAEEIEEQMSERGIEPRHIEGIPNSNWVILDYGEVVAHVFEPESRGFYNLEGLWHDAGRIEVPTREESSPAG